MSTATTSFFHVSGGNLPPEAPSYIVRQADEDLYTSLRQGEFCYVLDTRQVGKSSLMLHTAVRLRHDGVAVVVLDLTALGQSLTPEQWYLGLVDRIGQQLDLEDELEEFWNAHDRLGPLQRCMEALRAVVLERLSRPVVLFVDEIDNVRNLPFATDEFFAAMRECYNRRAHDAAFTRLTFCLLGVATPAELIQEARTTPFNIGRRIELTDFTVTDAAPLATGMGRQDGTGTALLRRILHWTGGHPYLTQRLCQAVAAEPDVTGNAGVDRVCAGLFFSPQALEQDHNLPFVQKHLLSDQVDRAGLLDLYARVRRRQRVRDDHTQPLVNHLRLSGITRTVHGLLHVRNRIYERVFNQSWVRTNMPDAELRRQRAAFRRGVVRTGAVAAAVLAVVVGLAFYARQQARIAQERTRYAQTQAQLAQERTQLAQEQTQIAQEQTRLAQENARRAEQNFQHALDAANAMVLELAYGLQPVMGTKSPTLERILKRVEGVFERLLQDAGDNPSALAGKLRMLLVYSDVARQLGNTGQALSRARQAHAIAEQLTSQDPTNTEWQRELSVSHNKMGDVLRQQGDLDGALAAYRAGLAIRERLAAQDATNTERQQDLSVSHERIGDVLRQQGDLDGALAAYRAGLAIREWLVAQDATNTEWQRGLSVSHNKMGDVLWQQGDLDGPLAAYRAGLAIRERLVAQDATNTEWQRDLSVSHERIGDVLRQRDDLDGALTAYRAGLTIAERLVAQDATNTEWQRDLLVSHNKIGDVLRQRDDLDGALMAYRAGLAIAEQLVTQDPTNVQWQYDLAISHERLGRVFLATGKPDAALDALHSARQLYETLARQYPGYIDFVRAPLVIYRMLVRLHTRQGNFAEVLPIHQKTVETIERLARRDPGNARWQRELPQALNSYAWTLLTAEPPDLRQPTEALTLAQRAVELSEQASPVEQARRLDTLAMAYHLTGDHTRAIEIAEQALGLVPSTTTDAGAQDVRQELETHLVTFRAAQQQSGRR